MKNKVILFVLLGLVLMTAGCGSGGSSSGDVSITGKVTVLALRNSLPTGPLPAGGSLEITNSELRSFLPAGYNTQTYIGKGYTVVIRGEFSVEPHTGDWTPGDHDWNKLQAEDVRLQERNGKFYLDFDTLIAKATANGHLSDISWDNSRYGGVKFIIFDADEKHVTELTTNYQLNVFAGLAPTPVANTSITVRGKNITATSGADGSFRIYGLSAGQYTLDITSNRYFGRWSIDVTVPGNVDIDMGYPNMNSQI